MRSPTPERVGPPQTCDWRGSRGGNAHDGNCRVRCRHQVAARKDAANPLQGHGFCSGRVPWGRRTPFGAAVAVSAAAVAGTGGWGPADATVERCCGKTSVIFLRDIARLKPGSLWPCTTYSARVARHMWWPVLGVDHDKVRSGECKNGRVGVPHKRRPSASRCGSCCHTSYSKAAFYGASARPCRAMPAPGRNAGLGLFNIGNLS